MTGPPMKAKIGMLQALILLIQTGRHTLMIRKMGLVATTTTKMILTTSVEPHWATMVYFRVLVLILMDF